MEKITVDKNFLRKVLERVDRNTKMIDGIQTVLMKKILKEPERPEPPRPTQAEIDRVLDFIRKTDPNQFGDLLT